jgi:transcriptional regulator with XRE-family HTH domain
MVPAGGRLTIAVHSTDGVFGIVSGVTAASYVNQARRAAGFSQRELARRTGVPQSAIARIERGQQIPRADTLERLLKACGFELRLGPVRGGAVDHRELDRFLALAPLQRVERGVAVAHVAAAFGIPDDGRTMAGVLRAALEDSTSPAEDGGET